jgi:lambda repressor-like predicted transcriptional regulator
MVSKKKSITVIVSVVLFLALGAGMGALVSTSVANAQSTRFQLVGVKFSNLVHQPRSDGENGFFRGNGFPGRGQVNDTYLAEALGISIEELQAAREKASTAAMEVAIENGEITEEQASLMQARQALRDYMNPEDLTAKALGITVEELKAAREEGKSLRDLMEELGISEEDLQVAMQTAREAAVQQAVDDGAITREQANLIRNNEASFTPGGPGGSDGKVGLGYTQRREGGYGFPGRDENMDTYLAEALGISLEELQAVKEKASTAAIEEAIKSGEITKDQANLMQARQALRGYIDQDALTAKALGIMLEEFQTARKDGKSPRDLMDELGISVENYQTARKAAYEAAIQQAVDDGVIIQEQADLILNSEMNLGPSGPGGFPGFGGGAGHPGEPGQPGQNPPPGITDQGPYGSPNGFPGGSNIPTPEGDA